MLPKASIQTLYGGTSMGKCCIYLGVGNNTPSIIKYPFWKYTLENPDAVYACVNFRQAYAPREIAEHSICLDTDIGLFYQGWIKRRFHKKWTELLS